MVTAPATSYHSYPSIFALGHRALADLFTAPVRIQEKIDGSQFSFGVFDGILRCRSKGQQIIIDAPEKMFQRAVDAVQAVQVQLIDGWTYRAEYLEKPHHNALSYDRIPKGHLILFDINDIEEGYLHHDDVTGWADRLGFDAVPQFFEGVWTEGHEALSALMDRESCLGGPKIEGIVVKSDSLYAPDKKRLMGKYVSEGFKETHKKTWGESNPAGRDIIDRLIQVYRSEARWQKAVQHLREAGQVEGSPRDIGMLIKEVSPDVLEECEDEIKEALMKWAWPQVSRGITRGLPEWYKEQLLAQQPMPEVSA